MPTATKYLVSNIGAETLQWAAEATASWLTISPTSGTLAPGQIAVVTASATTTAANLPPGKHLATLRFFNHSNGLGASQWPASLFAGQFTMDGVADSVGYTLSGAGITLRAAVRGTRLYVATLAPPELAGANDHHVFIADALLETATSPAPWAKRGSTALPADRPYLAAEGASSWAGWFDTPVNARLHRSTQAGGVLEGSIDLIETFGTIPEFIYLAAVAYETSDASPADAAAGRVISQAPAAVTADDDIASDEFLRIPVRAITDSAADGLYDTLAPERAFRTTLHANVAPASMELRWPTVPGRTYRVLYTGALAPASWEEIAIVTAGSTAWDSVLPVAREGRGFYKIEFAEPSP